MSITHLASLFCFVMKFQVFTKVTVVLHSAREIVKLYGYTIHRRGNNIQVVNVALCITTKPSYQLLDYFFNDSYS